MKMQKNNKINRGSEWNKCDLHLHSFYTSINNEFGSDFDKYLQKIKKENIKILGLTNYFNFVEEDWDLKSTLEEMGISVFLNLELRLTYQNKEDECCDLHLIFSDKISRKTIDAFLTKLNSSVDGTQKTLNMLNKQDKDIATVEFKDIVDTLNDPAIGIKDKVLIGMLSRGKGNARTSHSYETLTRSVHFIIHSSDNGNNISKDREYWSGRGEDRPLECKALFQSSDAHKIEDIAQKYTWIKGVPCFETLRQAIIDFENRLLIQDRNPIDKKISSPELFIDRIEYILKKKNRVLYFNKDINSVIGKRGSGKSVFLKHIVQEVVGNEGYAKKHGKEIKKLDNFKVHWSDNKNEDKFIEYIPQNYLSTITYEDGEKYDERDKELRRLLFNNNLFKNAEDNKAEIINSIELKIVANVKDILKFNKQTLEIKGQLETLGKIEDKNSAIKEKEKEIKKFGKIDITTKEINNQTKYVANIKKITREISLMEQDVKIIEGINKNKVDFIMLDDEVFAGLSQATLALVRKDINNASNNNIKKTLGSILKDLRGKLEKAEARKVKIKELLKPIHDKLQKNKTIETILKEINELKEKVEEMSKLVDLIEKNREKETQLINETVCLYGSFEEKISKIIKTLEDEFQSFTFITFIFNISYNISDYRQNFFDVFIDGRSGDRFKEVIEKRRDFQDDELRSIINDIVTEDEKIKIKTSGGNKESALVALLSCRYDIDFTKSVKYKNTDNTLIDFENMTGGQKAMAFLDLIFNLSKSNFPIVIDQPENDIDVSGISNDLKKLILQQKEKRQVIIATHSPNLLLLVDSENVIVAENEKDNIIYQNGGIENKDIQENIINILEGGREALIARMEKLNLKNNFD